MTRNSHRPDVGQGGILETLDRYPVTSGVILANLVVFGFCATRGGFHNGSISSEVLFDLGSNHFAMLKTQPWRLVTAAFLHANVLHLLFNLVAMFVIGRLVEVHYGSARTWVIYVACFLCGGLASAGFYASQGGGASVGASGGVLGLLLVGFVYASQNPRRLGGLALQLRSWILFALVFSIFVGGTDHAGHAGGALAGALIGWQLQPVPGKDAHPAWAPVAHVLAVLCLACFGLVVFSLRRQGLA